jgi:endonuclease YncB( thermonuclease family)
MDKIRGTVLRVIDGDTFDLDVSSTHTDNAYPYNDIERVRLRGIDAPELAARGGAAALSRLRAKLQGRLVQVDIHARDKFHRIVGDVLILSK